jgi:hypothetical protein
LTVLSAALKALAVARGQRSPRRVFVERIQLANGTRVVSAQLPVTQRITVSREMTAATRLFSIFERL